MNTVKNTNSSISLIDEDIFYVVYDKGTIITVADFEETEQVYYKFSRGQKLKFLVEFPKFVTATAEARKWAETNQVDAHLEAIVFSNLAQRLLIRFYLLLRTNKHPIEIFTNKEKALKWLRTEA